MDVKLQSLNAEWHDILNVIFPGASIRQQECEAKRHFPNFTSFLEAARQSLRELDGK